MEITQTNTGTRRRTRFPVATPLLAFALLALPTKLPAEAAPPTSVTREAVDRAISLAGDYLVKACNADGRFAYEVDLTTGDALPTYNVVRHAGVMYALGMLQREQPTDSIAAALRRSAGYLRSRFVRPGPSFENQSTLAVWAEPIGQPRSDVATLGATGLGLVGLLVAQPYSAPPLKPAELESLGRFLLFLQRPDGGFNSKYLARDGGSFTAWGSLYYPGEAALALVLLSRQGGDSWLTAAEKALVYLANSRRGARVIPADHWALIATAEVFARHDADSAFPARELLIAHAVQVCESILAEQINDGARPAWIGGFETHGRTTPTSTRLEGLLATLQFLPASQSVLRARIRAACTRGIAFLLATQLKSGPHAGAVPAAAAPCNAVIRIDFVQHFLSALLRYRALPDFAPQ